MRITFKGKVRRTVYADGTLAYEYIKVPTLNGPKHCDMTAARQHPKYGALANSTLFAGQLAGIKRRYFPKGEVRLNALPDGVNVNTDGFLAVVTVDVP